MNTRERKVIEFILENYNKVILYREKYENIDMTGNITIDKLPLISKLDVARNGLNVISDEYYVKMCSNQLKSFRTSGSTGESCEIYWDKSDDLQSMIELFLLRKKYYGIMPSDKMCYFYPSDVDGIDDFYYEKGTFGISKACLYNNNINNAYKKILDYNPVWMILQPSIALYLCEIICEKNYAIPSNLKYIELTGEYLSEEARKNIQSIFQCNIANQYGMKEFNSIAYECPYGVMHCMENNVYSEEVKGELVITTLKNRAMPLIRFKSGDKGKIYEVDCKCGKHGKAIKLLNGRKDDFIRSKNGTRTHAYAAIQIIQNINYLYDGIIIHYQIVQKSMDKLVIKAVPRYAEDKDKIAILLVNGFRKRFDDEYDIDINFLDYIENDGKNKVAVFISEITNEREG